MKGQVLPALSLEERVSVLEQEISELKSRQGNARDKDWRRTIGVFTDNPQMKELFAEAMKLHGKSKGSGLNGTCALPFGASTPRLASCSEFL